MISGTDTSSTGISSNGNRSTTSRCFWHGSSTSRICPLSFHFVSKKTPTHVLLRLVLKRRAHLFSIFNEFGDITGTVTMEDMLESVLAQEIADEVGAAVNIQAVAQL